MLAVLESILQKTALSPKTPSIELCNLSEDAGRKIKDEQPWAAATIVLS